jgi:hypothetical protein
MSVSPLQIVAGTTLLFLVALIVFVITLIRAARAARARRWATNIPAHDAPASDQRPVDTSLEGLEVEVSQDAPSAVLLTPLRTGDWKPPIEPAPLGSLEAASLDGRIAEYQSAPNIADPSFSIRQYAGWEMGTEGTPQDESAVTSSMPRLPESVGDAELDAELAALLPELDDGPRPVSSALIPVQPERERTPATEQEPERLHAHGSEPEPAPEPGQVLAPMPLPEPVLEPEPELIPAPQSAPMAPMPSETVSRAVEMIAPELMAAPEPDSVMWLAPVPESAPGSDLESAPKTEIESDEDTEFWSGLMAQQSKEQVHAATPAAPLVPRPEVKVVPDIATAIAPPVPEVDAPPIAPSRPQVRVHVAAVDSSQTIRAGASGVTLVMNQERNDRESVIPQLVLAAPVEMWFGDARVGVKAGTATYDRFRKYADVLLTDLKASRPPER